MSEDNIEVVRRTLDAIARGDVPAMLEQVDAAVEVNPVLSVWPQTYRGHEGIEQWWQDVTQLWEEFSVDAEGFRELSDEALLVLVRWRGRAKGGAAEVDGPAAAVVRFKGGKVVSADFYLDEERAVQDAGLDR